MGQEFDMPGVEHLRMPKGGFKRRHVTRAEFVRELLKEHPSIVVSPRPTAGVRGLPLADGGLDATPTSPKERDR